MVEILAQADNSRSSDRVVSGGNAAYLEAMHLLDKQPTGSRGDRTSVISNDSMQFDNIYDKTGTSDSCQIDGPCSFRPDKTLSTPRAREWARQADEQNQKPLDKDGDVYTVKPGDCLTGIAKRALEQDGQKHSAKEIDQLAKDIAEANKEKYPSLGCNRDLIKPGMELTIPELPQAQGQGNGDGGKTGDGRSQGSTDGGATSDGRGQSQGSTDGGVTSDGRGQSQGSTDGGVTGYGRGQAQGITGGRGETRPSPEGSMAIGGGGGGSDQVCRPDRPDPPQDLNINVVEPPKQVIPPAGTIIWA